MYEQFFPNALSALFSGSALTVVLFGNDFVFFSPQQPCHVMSLQDSHLRSHRHQKLALLDAQTVALGFGVTHLTRKTRNMCINYLAQRCLFLGVKSCSMCSAEGHLLSWGCWSTGEVRSSTAFCFLWKGGRANAPDSCQSPPRCASITCHTLGRTWGAMLAVPQWRWNS